MAQMQFFAVIKKLFTIQDFCTRNSSFMAIPRDAMIDSFLLNYGFQGIVAEIMGGSFVDYLNYYEQIAYESKWFRIQND